MRVQDELQICVETAAQHRLPAVQNFVSGEVMRPCKQWIQDVIDNRKECDTLRLRTPDFVLLPDTSSRRNAVPQWLTCRNTIGLRMLGVIPQDKKVTVAKQPKYYLNWLSIICDRNLRTLRDLRREHVPMLQNMKRQCMHVIKQYFEVSDGDVLIFANYPPSVYQLHFHWCCVSCRISAYDALRMHSLTSIIYNLERDSMFYAESCLQIPLYKDSVLYNLLRGDVSDCKDDSDAEQQRKINVLHDVDSGAVSKSQVTEISLKNLHL